MAKVVCKSDSKTNFILIRTRDFSKVFYLPFLGLLSS